MGRRFYDLEDYVVRHERDLGKVWKELKIVRERIFHVEQSLHTKVSMLAQANIEGRLQKLECENHIWTIRTFLDSCNSVKSRGESSIVFACIKCHAINNVSMSKLTPQERKIAQASGIKLPKEKELKNET